MITTSISSSIDDLQGILALQKQNLKVELSAEEMIQQGFVSVSHTLADLEKMHTYEPNIVTKDGEKVIAYVLAMTAESTNDIPVLVDMYESFNHVLYQGKPISDYRYLVVGQVCVDKNYRGEGLFDKCYQAFKNQFNARYDFAVTEVASVNLRSMKAHNRVGFKVIETFTDSSNVEWNMVVWDWRL